MTLNLTYMINEGLEEAVERFVTFEDFLRLGVQVAAGTAAPHRCTLLEK